MNPKKQSKCEDRFDKRFYPKPILRKGERLLAYSIDSSEAKEFIREERKRWVEELKKARLTCKTCAGWNERLDKLLNSLEKGGR